MIDEFTILIILGAIFITILVVIIIRIISLIPKKLQNKDDSNQTSSLFGSSGGRVEKLKVNKIDSNNQSSGLYSNFNKIANKGTLDSSKTVKFLDITSLNQHARQIVNLNSMMKQSNNKELEKPISGGVCLPEDFETKDINEKVDNLEINNIMVKEDYVPATIFSKEILHVTSGICLWLDSQDKFNLYQDIEKEIDITNSNQKIAYVTDKSIYNNDMTQINPSKRPVYIEDQEGVPTGIKFVGSSLLEGMNGLGNFDEYTVIFVGVNSLKSTIWPGIFTTKPSGSSEENVRQGFAVFGEKDSYKVNFESGKTIINTFDESNPNVGLLIGETTHNEANNQYKVGNWLGLDQYFEGVVCEIIVYNRKLDESEIKSIQIYLNHKWHI